MTQRAVEKFLAHFEEIQRLHVAVQGRALEMYKQTEPACLVAVFEHLLNSSSTGPSFVSDMVHRLVWGQCLGNGNHRTTTLFVADWLAQQGIRFPHYADQADGKTKFGKDLAGWINRSQALIRRRGKPGFAQARLEPRHREITTAWVTEMLGHQSGALTMVGPQRLMKSFS